MLDTEYWAGRDAGYTGAQTDHQTDHPEGTPEYREGYRHGVFIYLQPTYELVGAGASA
jgi:hypothetical protein